MTHIEAKIKDICNAYLHYCINTNGADLFDQWLATPQARTLIDELSGMGGNKMLHKFACKTWPLIYDNKRRHEEHPSTDWEVNNYAKELYEMAKKIIDKSAASQSQGGEKKEEVQLYTRGQMYEIANRFYGSDYNMTEETFDNYMSHIHHYRQNQ